ncbi:hypothetical protein SK128_011786 [Halocaridina rubra]|uniref:Peptidase M14 domain-containing protein n=1 Tax=Halocaridina rubra TaxID=373956 RepID=A0AAN8X0G5_HALRR
MGRLTIFTFALLVGLSAAYTTNYHGYQVWRVENIQEWQVERIRSVIDTLLLDVWASGDSWVDIMVKPEIMLSLGKTLARHGFEYKVFIGNLQSLIDSEFETLKLKKESRAVDNTAYHDLAEIEAYMTEAASTNSWVTMESIGTTDEGRDLFVNILAVPGSGPKPSVWIDCGIHAREWISPATCLYGIDYLTTGYSVDADVTALLDKYDVYIMPVHNPDGYSYTWTNDRMWRKNRVANSGSCRGVDLNRNFDDGHWGGIGSSNNECSETYHGPSGFSELESQAVRDYTTNLISNNGLSIYYTIHSYSQVWMYAYGWTSDLTPENDQLEAAARAGCDALTAVHGTSYAYGTIYHAIYPASGTSIDWGYSAGVVHTYTLELRDTGSWGFLLPADQIIPTGEETWAGLIASIMSI